MPTPKRVYVPELGKHVAFPDDYTESDRREYIASLLPRQEPPTPPPPAPAPPKTLVDQIEGARFGTYTALINTAAAIPDGIGGVINSDYLKGVARDMRESDYAKSLRPPEASIGTFGEQAGNVAGSLIGMMSPTTALRGVAYAPKIARGLSALMGAAQGASEQVQESQRNRAEGMAVTPEQETSAARWGTTTGLLDMVGGGVYDRLARGAGMHGVKELAKEGLGTFGKGVLKTGVVEGLTEGGQKWGQNLIENKVYNPNQGLMENVPESMATGFAAGAGLDGLIQGYARRIAKNVDAKADVQRARQAAPQVDPDVEAAIRVRSNMDGTADVGYVAPAVPEYGVNKRELLDGLMMEKAGVPLHAIDAGDAMALDAGFDTLRKQGLSDDQAVEKLRGLNWDKMLGKEPQVNAEDLTVSGKPPTPGLPAPLPTGEPPLPISDDGSFIAPPQPPVSFLDTVVEATENPAGKMTAEEKVVAGLISPPAPKPTPIAPKPITPIPADQLYSAATPTSTPTTTPAPLPTVDAMRTDLEAGSTPAIATEVHEEMKRLGIDDLMSTRLIDNFGDTRINGKYLKDIVSLSLEGRNTKQLLSTLNHESVHAMKQMGLFNDAEWRILQAAMDPAIILDDEERKIYTEYYGNDTGKMQEEAIARGMEKFMSGKLNLANVPGSIIQKKLGDLAKIGDVFRSNKLDTAEKVANAFRSGEIGRRPLSNDNQISNDQTGGDPRIKTTEDPQRTQDDIDPALGETDDEGFLIPEGEVDDTRLSVKQEPVAKQLAAELDERGETRKMFDALITPSKGSVLGGKWLKFRQETVDMYAPIEDLSMKHGDAKNANVSAINAIRIHGIAEDIATASLASGPPDLIDGAIQATETGGLIPVIKKASDSGVLDKGNNYLIASHAMSLDPVAPEKYVGNGATKQDVIDALAYGSDARVQEYVAGKNKFNDGLVNMAVKSGLITPEIGEKWKKGDHISFYREDVDANEGVISQGKGSTLASTPKIHKIKPSDKQIANPLENIVRNTNMLTALATKNLAKQRVIRDGLDLKIVRQAPKTVTKNVVTVYYKGKPAKFEILDDLLYRSLTATKISVDGWWKIGLLPSNFLRASITMDPIFMLRNMERDTAMTWAHGYTNAPYASAGKGFYDALNKSVSFRDLERQGVLGSNIRGEGASQTARNIKYIVDPSLESGLSKVRKQLREFAQASESANRIVIYENVLKRTGGNKVQAAAEAREIMNFNRKGANAAVQILTAIVPFSNARMQGLDVLWRNTRESRTPNKEMRSRLINRSVTMTGLTLAYVALASQTQTWNDATEEERSMNFFLPNPTGGEAIRVPIPFELGYAIKALPEHLAMMYMGKEDGKAFMGAMSRYILSALSLNPIPQVIKPATEVIANYDFYRGREVEAPRLRRLEKPERTEENTTEIAKQIAGHSMGQLSPVQADHLLRGYSGTSMMYAVHLLDSLITDGKSMDFADRKTSQLPVVGKLFQKEDGAGPLVEYYSIINSANMAAASLKDAANPDERMRKLAAFEKANRGDEAQVSRIAKLKKKVNEDMRKGLISSKQAAEVLSQLGPQQTAIARRVVEKFKAQ